MYVMIKTIIYTNLRGITPFCKVHCAPTSPICWMMIIMFIFLHFSSNWTRNIWWFILRLVMSEKIWSLVLLKISEKD